jgi:DNA-binding LytR/AlgR family response regulator
MIRALALDDEPPALRILAHFCGQFDDLDLVQACTRADDALRYLRAEPVDLLFLDINMPALSGIDFHQQLATPPPVIFTTAYAEYAVEGFNLNAVDYLLKPFTLARFGQAIEKVRQLRQRQPVPAEVPPAHVFIRADYSLHKVSLDAIRFVEGLDDYLKIHLDGRHPLVARLTMKAMLDKLQEADPTGTRFVRVHRSYIVPLARIGAVRNRMITLEGEDLPIGASYEAEFFQRFRA